VSLAYLDSSALVKLVVREAESPALEAHLDATTPALASSVVAQIELLRAVRRVLGSPSPEEKRARDLLSRLTLIEVDESVVANSIEVQPAALRTLDAIHLATARSVGGELSAFIAYDRRLLAAASEAGLPVRTPGPAT
jgi:uncharacterized protein